jgi:NitT/TauT family transport system substrate-binding protein
MLMGMSFRSVVLAGAMALSGLALGPVQAQNSEPIHVALADLPEVETLFFLVGLERARERGVESEITFFNGEELAIQAVLAGQADIGLGSPYAVIQNANVPVRLFQQVSRLVFFPVVKSEIENWQDMEGVSMTFHQRGGPLEPLAAIMSEREGITLGRPNYVPGSENRVVALTQGHIDAALIDLLNKNMIMEQHPDKFRVLPWVEEVVTDEALFARQDWLEENKDRVAILVEELLKSAQELCDNPRSIAEAREKYDLLPDLPQDLVDQLADYYEEAIQAGVYSCDGGGAEAARIDIDVLSKSGQLKGTPEELAVENFWHLAPLEQAQAKLGITPGEGGGSAAQAGESGATPASGTGGSETNAAPSTGEATGGGQGGASSGTGAKQ